jgi:hypothetical protein
VVAVLRLDVAWQFKSLFLQSFSFTFSDGKILWSYVPRRRCVDMHGSYGHLLGFGLVVIRTRKKKSSFTDKFYRMCVDMKRPVPEPFIAKVALSVGGSDLRIKLFVHIFSTNFSKWLQLRSSKD